MKKCILLNHEFWSIYGLSNIKKCTYYEISYIFKHNVPEFVFS